MTDEVLMEIQRTLGRIEQKTDGTIEWMKKHSELNIADFAKVNGAVKVLELEHASRRGTAKAWNILGMIGGALLGAAGGYFGSRH